MERDITLELEIQNRVVSGLKGQVSYLGQVNPDTQVDWYESYGPARIMAVDGLNINTLRGAESALLIHCAKMIEEDSNCPLGGLYGINWKVVPRGNNSKTKKYKTGRTN